MCFRLIQLCILYMSKHFGMANTNFIYIYIYTGCHRRNGPNFGRVFLMLNYTDITQNTYVPSWTVIEIMAKRNCGLPSVPRTIAVSWVPLSITARLKCISLHMSDKPGDVTFQHSSVMYFEPYVLLHECEELCSSY